MIALIEFWFSEKGTWNAISDLYFHKESGYSEENTSDYVAFCSSILQPFQFEPEQKIFFEVMRAMKHLFTNFLQNKCS